MNDAEIPTNAAILIHNMLMSVCDLENRRKIRKPMNIPFNFGIEFQFCIINFLLSLIKSRSIYY